MTGITYVFFDILKLIGSYSGNIHSGCTGEWSLSVVHCMDILKIMYVCVCFCHTDTWAFWELQNFCVQNELFAL
jgi:hypothetical protein